MDYKIIIGIISPNPEPAQKLLAGYEVKTDVKILENPDENIYQQILSDTPELLLLDLDMKETDPLQVCRKLTSEVPIPVVLYGDQPSEDTVQSGFQAGADEVISIGTNDTISKKRFGRVLNQIKYKLDNRQLSDQLREKTRLLEASEALKKRILKIVGHDMRNPLNGIIGITDLILSEGIENQDELKQMLQLVENSGENLLDLVNKLLEVIKSESYDESLFLENTDMVVLTEKVYQLQLPSARKKGITLTRKVDPELKAVRVDPAKVEHIMGDLVNNAIKFTPTEGRVSLEISRKDRDTLEIIVEDTGIGIQAASIHQLTQKSNNRMGTAGEKGHGIGIPVVQKFVKLHGGDFHIESAKDQGTTFKVNLPIP